MVTSRCRPDDVFKDMAPLFFKAHRKANQGIKGGRAGSHDEIGTQDVEFAAEPPWVRT